MSERKNPPALRRREFVKTYGNSRINMLYCKQNRHADKKENDMGYEEKLHAFGAPGTEYRPMYYFDFPALDDAARAEKIKDAVATCKKAERIEVVFPRATSTFLSISSSSCLVNG